jgi:hypothetical protein
VADERCDLLVSACAHCRDGERAGWLAELRRELLTRPGWVAAVYPGRCCACGDDYAPGAAIHAAPGRPPVGSGRRWLAECCADEVSTHA